MPSSNPSAFRAVGLLLAALMTTISPVSAYTVESASFGQTGKIAPEGHLKGWLLGGKGYNPEILSDKIILTPPYPGHVQGSIRAERPMNVPDFLVDFEFRATGPDHGQGQLQLWYTRENGVQIGTNNLYSVGKFTGLALLIDQSGGRGGGIRAFLNDGSVDYGKAKNIEQLTFGHCDHPYRNLGRPSKLQLHQDSLGLEVLLDGRRCFRAENVFLPKDNFWGITANTGENPDSFEVFKFVTQTGTAISREEPVKAGQMGGSPGQHQQQQQQSQHMAKPPPPKVGGTHDSPMLNDIHSHMLKVAEAIPNGVEQIRQQIENLNGPFATKDDVRLLENKLNHLTEVLEKIAKDQKDYSGHFQDIHREIKAGSTAFLDQIPERMGSAITKHGPNMMQIVFIIIAAQLVMGLAYIIWKRRESSPKKYL